MEYRWSDALGLFLHGCKPRQFDDSSGTSESERIQFLAIHKTDDGNTNVLHVERVETHSPESLFARNEELYGLADRLGLESYDGMDVGPAPQ